MEYLSDLQVCIRWKCEGGVLILVLMEYSLTNGICSNERQDAGVLILVLMECSLTRITLLRIQSRLLVLM